jgi:hypothetical protein
MGERESFGHDHGHDHGMTKPVLLTCLAFLVAGVVGIGGLVYVQDVDIAIAGLLWAAVIELIALTK